LISAINGLSEVQNKLESVHERFTKNAIKAEYGPVTLNFSYENYKARQQIYAFSIIEFIMHAMRTAQFEKNGDIWSIDQAYAADLEHSMHYILENGRDYILPLTEDVAFYIYNDGIEARRNDKMVLIAIIIASMVATLICYLLIIPRVLSVVRHKSDVMQIFADISTQNIREMLNGISQISIDNAAYDTKNIDDMFTSHDSKKESKINNENTLNQQIQMKDENSNITKLTETPITQAVITKNVTENLEDQKTTESGVLQGIDKEKLQRKRETLKQADHGTKKKSLITVTAIAFGIWIFYGASIGLVEMIFNYYDDLTLTLKWIVLREPYFTNQLFLLRELLVTNNTKYEIMLQKYTEESFEIERTIQKIKVSGSSITKKFREMSLLLDSDKFCDIIAKQAPEDTIQRCQNFNNSSMQRGMQNNLFQIFADINYVHNLYSLKKNTNYSFSDILSNSKWDLISIFLVE